MAYLVTYVGPSRPGETFFSPALQRAVYCAYGSTVEVDVTDLDGLLQQVGEWEAASPEAEAWTPPPIVYRRFVKVRSDTGALEADDGTAIITPSSMATKAETVRGWSPKMRPATTMWAFAGKASNGWVQFSSPGTTVTLEDTSMPLIGDRSAKVVTNGGGGGAYAVVQQGSLSINATGMAVRLWVRVADVTRLGSLAVILGDSAMTNYFTATVYSPPSSQVEAKSNIKSGETCVIDVPWSAFTATGTPNRAALTVARVSVTDTGAGPVTVWVGGVAGVAEQSAYPNGVVSLTFDDSHASSLDLARYMDRYGMPGTLFPVLDKLDTSGCLTTAQVAELASVHGWEVGFHATSTAKHAIGAENMTTAELVAECEALRAWGYSNGYSGESFAWPLTTFSSAAENVVRRHFRSARGGIFRTTESLPPTAPYRLRSQPANASTSLSTLQAYVAAAKTGKSWAIITFHGIVASGATGNDTTTAIAQGIVDYCAAQGVPVRTVDQVMNTPM